MRTLAQDFDQFILTLPEEVRTKHRDEIEQAYYAGASTVFALTVLGDDPGSSAQVESLHNECSAFADKMMKRLGLA